MLSARRGTACCALAAALLSVAACDDDPRRAAGAVAGTWVLVEPEGEETVYLRITADSVVVFQEDEIADCFERTDYEILDVDGDRFELGVGDDEVTIHMRRDDDQLVVDAFDVEQRYDASTVDPGTLLLCGPPSTDADCATLPALAFDATVDGTITSGDDETPGGEHFDEYRLDVAAADSVQIDMESGDVDSYLFLFDSAGAFIAQNDDRSSLTLDARIGTTLAPACYIVMATTAFPDEFGDYELTVSLP